MHPRHQQRTNGVELARGDLLLRPLVILGRADDEFDLVGGLEVSDVFKTILCNLAAAGTFQIHDAPHARINERDVMGAARFDEHDEAVVTELFHHRQGILLE